MRDYGKVFSRIWESADFRAMSEDGRTICLYLLTSQHGTIAGVFRIPDGYACEDLQWTAERVAEGFRELFAKGFARRCEVTKWVWIVKHFEWNPPENPNQRKAALKVANQVPAACSWRAEFTRACGGFMDMPPAPVENPSGTLPEPLPNQEQYQEQYQEQKIPAPKPSASKRSSVLFKTFLSDCKAKGERPISAYKPVFDYAESIGLPADFVCLCWDEFFRRYSDGGTADNKRYADWRKAFYKCVEGNWFKLWWLNNATGQYELTTAGHTAQRAAS